MASKKQSYKNIKKARESELDVLEFYGEETERVLEKISQKKVKNRFCMEKSPTKYSRSCKVQKTRCLATDEEFSRTTDSCKHQDENAISRRQHKKKPLRNNSNETKTMVCHNISFKNIRCC